MASVTHDTISIIGHPVAPAPTRVEVRDFSMRYNRHHSLALEKVQLTVEPGQVLALLGPSGSGKTSILRAIAGFVRPHISESGLLGRLRGLLTSDDDGAYATGSIFFDGHDVSRDPPANRHVAMVRQTWDLLPHLTARDSLTLAATLQGEPRAKARTRADSVLASLGLIDKAGCRPAELSGGEVQRLAIGRLLMRHDARAYLFDECLNSLDASLRRQALRQLRSLLRERPVTSLWVTHLPEEARAVADIVGVMAGGHLEQIGAFSELEERPASDVVFKTMTGQTDEYLFASTIEDGRLQLPGSRCELPMRLANAADVRVAIRNGGWKISNDGNVVGTVADCVSASGGHYLTTASFGGWLADITTDISLTPGNPLTAFVDTDAVFLFDRKDGRRLMPE